MNVNKPSMMISREDVVRLLQTQADAFDKKFTEFEDIGADMILKQREMEANTDRTKDLGENMKTVVFASINTKEKQETAILTLQTQVANLTAEVGRLHDHLANHRGPSTSSLRDIRTQHDLIRGLITDMEKQADLTNTRQVKEANMVCNCTHKTINDNMAGMRRRMTNIEKRFKKKLRQLPFAGKSVTNNKAQEETGESEDEATDKEMEDTHETAEK